MKRDLTNRRKRRTRFSLRHARRQRLSVFRSLRHISAQVICDQRGHTLAQASSLEKGLRDRFENVSGQAVAAEIGRLVAQRAQAAGVTQVVFDRGSYLYHGRVRALAEAARKEGLDF